MSLNFGIIFYLEGRINEGKYEQDIAILGVMTMTIEKRDSETVENINIMRVINIS